MVAPRRPSVEALACLSCLVYALGDGPAQNVLRQAREHEGVARISIYARRRDAFGTSAQRGLWQDDDEEERRSGRLVVEQRAHPSGRPEAGPRCAGKRECTLRRPRRKEGKKEVLKAQIRRPGAAAAPDHVTVATKGRRREFHSASQ
jgi:hypothetical protein